MLSAFYLPCSLRGSPTINLSASRISSGPLEAHIKGLRRTSTSGAQIMQEAVLLESPNTPRTRRKPITQLPTPSSTPRKRKGDLTEDSETRADREQKRVTVVPGSPPLADGSPRRRKAHD